MYLLDRDKERALLAALRGLKLTDAERAILVGIRTDLADREALQIARSNTAQEQPA